MTRPPRGLEQVPGAALYAPARPAARSTCFLPGKYTCPFRPGAAGRAASEHTRDRGAICLCLHNQSELECAGLSRLLATPPPPRGRGCLAPSRPREKFGSHPRPGWKVDRERAEGGEEGRRPLRWSCASCGGSFLFNSGERIPDGAGCAETPPGPPPSPPPQLLAWPGPGPKPGAGSVPGHGDPASPTPLRGWALGLLL